MKLASLVGHIIELTELTHSGPGQSDSVADDRKARPTDRVVTEFFRARKYLGSHDRRFISQAVYGIIRFRRRVETLLDQYFNDHPAVPKPRSPEAREYLQFITYTTAIEEVDPQQIIDLLQQPWLETLPELDLPDITYWMVQNKAMNFLQGDDIQQLASWYSFEEWMIKDWIAQFGPDETEDLIHALNSEAPVTLRVNTLKTSVEACQQRLKDEGVETTTTTYSPVGLVARQRFNAQASGAFKDGLFEIQDEGSQIVCALADPGPGDFIIDACAGAGGKTLMLAALMQNRGEILAFDKEPKRSKELQKRVARAGAKIVVAQRAGSLRPTDLFGKADRVLLDVPCSGVGTIRRNPSLKWNVTPSLIHRLAKQQGEILDTYAPYVKRGGRLVYVTCSLLQKENEEVMEHFLRQHNEFEPTTPTPVLNRIGIAADSAFVKLLPHRHNTDGFFVAVLERNK